MTLNVITGSGVHIEPGMPGQVGQTPPAINIPVPEEATQVSPQSSPETSSLSLRTADHQPAPFIHPTVSFDGQEIKPPTCPPQEAVAGLKRKFQSLLQNLAQSRPESLRQILLQVYGSKLSEKPELLEHLIRLASQGKLPLPVRIELVPAEALRNNHAAYSHQDGGTIYLNQDLLSAPETLNAAFLEEMGHHLDHQLGGSDTPGDEGEAFMRALLKQAPLSDGQLAQVRSDQDQGQITVHGQTLTVEFQASGTVTCNLGTLANGGSATVAIAVTPQSAGTITNTAAVTAAVPLVIGWSKRKTIVGAPATARHSIPDPPVSGNGMSKVVAPCAFRETADVSSATTAP